jgi:hypothetical protein
VVVGSTPTDGELSEAVSFLFSFVWGNFPSFFPLRTHCPRSPLMFRWLVVKDGQESLRLHLFFHCLQVWILVDVDSHTCWANRIGRLSSRWDYSRTVIDRLPRDSDIISLI